jgi:cell division protein FtsB
MGKLIRFQRKRKARKDEAARALFPPFGSNAPDARAALFPSDACASEEVARAAGTPDPEIERKQTRRQRRIVFGLAVVFLGGTAAALFGNRGELDVQRQRVRLREMQEANAEHLARVQALRREVERLKTDPFAVERIAREDLGYVAKNELTLLLPGDDPAKAPRVDSKTRSGIVPGVRNKP